MKPSSHSNCGPNLVNWVQNQHTYCGWLDYNLTKRDGRVIKKLKLNSVAQSANEIYRPSDCRLSAKLVQIFADRGCNVVSMTDTYGRILGFLDRSPEVPQLYSRGWVDPVPDPLLLRKSGSAGNRNRTSGSVARNYDHKTTQAVYNAELYSEGVQFEFWPINWLSWPRFCSVPQDECGRMIRTL
jgi:hypothetical protein